MSIGAVFSSVEHELAWGVQELVRGARALSTILIHVQATESTVEGLTALVAPQAVIAERAAYGILGLVIKAVQDAGAAADAHGVNVQLDAATVADIKAIIPAVHAQLGAVGVSAPSQAVAAK